MANYEKNSETSSDMKNFDISLLEESIIPSITELTLDNDWRVRLGIIEKFPNLAKKFGQECFNLRLFDLRIALLSDNVREIFDDKWVFNKLIPELMTKHYLHRIIYLL